jgi:hypothetical protein
MNRTLWTFGDSFVEGLLKDLDNDTRNSPEERQEICFGNQLFKNYDIFSQHYNFGASGAGNEQIAYTVTKMLNRFSTGDFVFIAFSGPLRAATYSFQKDEYQRVLDNTPPYTQHVSARRSPIWQVDLSIAYLSEQLDRAGVKYLFTNSFEPTSVYSTLQYEQLYRFNYFKPEYIDNTLFDILLGEFLQTKTDRLNYMKVDPREDRISLNKFKNVNGNKFISDCNHPTPEGHKLIADTYLPIILNEYER